jgi:hypothetical protein
MFSGPVKCLTVARLCEAHRWCPTPTHDLPRLEDRADQRPACEAIFKPPLRDVDTGPVDQVSLFNICTFGLPEYDNFSLIMYRQSHVTRSESALHACPADQTTLLVDHTRSNIYLMVVTLDCICACTSLLASKNFQPDHYRTGGYVPATKVAYPSQRDMVRCK